MQSPEHYFDRAQRTPHWRWIANSAELPPIGVIVRTVRNLAIRDLKVGSIKAVRRRGLSRSRRIRYGNFYRARDDYGYWQGHGSKAIKRINQLICETQRTTFEGIGKPILALGNPPRCATMIASRATASRPLAKDRPEGDASRASVPVDGAPS
jgi:hypothetical protein